jgi:uncharacterized protein
MSHQIQKSSADSENVQSAAYFWKFRNRDNFLQIVTRGEPQLLVEGSEQEFITEHYWGCSVQRDGSTLEYRVEHPRWRIWESQTAELHSNVVHLYGEQFGDVLSQPPSSAFLAEGSEIKVYKGVKLKM